MRIVESAVIYLDFWADGQAYLHIEVRIRVHVIILCFYLPLPPCGLSFTDSAMSLLRTKNRSSRREDIRREGARQNTTGGFSQIMLRETVAKAIENLPEKLRQTVVLHYREHLPFETIATRLKISGRTARRDIKEAYLLLRAFLRYRSTPTTKRRARSCRIIFEVPSWRLSD